MNIEVNNKTRSSIDEGFLRSIAEEVLKSEGVTSPILSIALVGTKEMRELNKKHRNMDKVANVLSFSGGDSALGEVVICPREVRKDAKKYDILFREAMAWMLIHGILHLLEYGHEQGGKQAKLMEEKEESYLNDITL